jgi:ABC-type glutathione transport system ATPase component
MTALLATEDVVCAFGNHRAVDAVTLALGPGEALGLVGESGSGKTTILRLLLRLVPATSGRILFNGQDITHAPERELAPMRRAVQVVFQNPHAALDPRSSVFASVAEPLRLQGGMTRAALRARVTSLLQDVGLGDEFLWRHPHELSGGQKQRVCIARALAPGPRALLLDEPTSALDVSVQAQIIELLAALRARHGLAYLFVSHNLAVVRLLCERVAVMRDGKLVEAGPAAQVLASPAHPYTKALLEAVLSPRANRKPCPSASGPSPPRHRCPGYGTGPKSPTAAHPIPD